MLQIRLPRDVDVLFVRESLARLLRERQHARELLRIEMPLVEQLLRRLDDGGDDARLADDAA